MLSLSSEPRGPFTVVRVSGHLDLTARDQFDQYLTAARRGSPRLIIDMSEVTFMDTGCLAVIVGHYKRLAVAGGLILAGARYRPAKALWITGLAYRLPLYDSVDEAIAADGGGALTVGEEPPADQQLPATS
ncbi:MAG: STAS domain-containing protein [Actinobacteria bacterium]|nr:STAS domain-containing protein [Actinomycetota bacterium]